MFGIAVAWIYFVAIYLESWSYRHQAHNTTISINHQPMNMKKMTGC